MIFTSCSGVKHCGNARTCQRCARERQSKIANTAEAMEKQHGQLTLTVLIPNRNAQEEIRRLRASFIRRAVVPAGIWTIEAGEKFGGLHLNILSPKPAPATWRNCSSYSELVRCTSREAAAYIAKQSGMPPIEQYTGNLYGTFGQIFNYLSSNAAYPTIQAAAIEATMSGNKGAWKEPTRETEQAELPINRPTETKEARMEKWKKTSKWERRHPLLNQLPHDINKNERIEQATKPKRTKEERAEIMRRNLPNLYAAISPATQYKPKQTAPTGENDEWQEGRE